MTRTRLTIEEARRVALAAQGFANRGSTKVSRRHLRSLFKRIGQVQIDSINVVVRAHYMPAFSRLGAYPPELLDHLVYSRRQRELFEYWGHEASLISLDLFPALRWRMARASQNSGTWGRLARFGRERKPLIAELHREVVQRGPLSAGQLARLLETKTTRKASSWWGWSEVKTALEWLFWAGEVTTSFRKNFERVYDITERVIPPEIYHAPVMTEEEAHRQLLRVAARAHGIATESDLRDYFRLSPHDSKKRVQELVEAGELIGVEVEGWPQPAYLHREARIPRRLSISTLISPFDPLVWERQRAERLFGFRYRIEIYVPAAKRQHGYYVLPFFCDDNFGARIDLKADRATSSLSVLAAHHEGNHPHQRVAESLARELERIADWLGLEQIRISNRGDLSSALRKHFP